MLRLRDDLPSLRQETSERVIAFLGAQYPTHAIRQPGIPVSFAGVEAKDDSTAEKSQLIYRVSNKTGKGIRLLDISVFFLDSQGKVIGGEGYRASNFLKLENGDLAGELPLSPRKLLLSASSVTVAIREVVGDEQSWRESVEDIISHLQDLHALSQMSPELTSKIESWETACLANAPPTCTDRVNSAEITVLRS